MHDVWITQSTPVFGAICGTSLPMRICGFTDVYMINSITA